jgi:hypothetical protein
MRKLNSRERWLFRATILAVAVGFLLRFVWVPLQEWRSRGSVSWANQGKGLEDLQSDLERARQFKESLRRQKEKIGHPAARLAEPREKLAVMGYLDKFSKENGVALTKFNPSSVDTSSKVPYFDVQLSGKGNYKEVVKFFHNLQYVEYFMRPVSLKLTGGKELQIEMKVRVYVGPEKGPRPQEQASGSPDSAPSPARS